MKTKEIKLSQYENCKECPYGEDPADYKGRRIPIPGGGVLKIHEFLVDKNGNEVPNPIVGRCGVSGNKLKKERWEIGCARWFHGSKVVNV